MILDVKSVDDLKQRMKMMKTIVYAPWQIRIHVIEIRFDQIQGNRP